MLGAAVLGWAGLLGRAAGSGVTKDRGDKCACWELYIYFKYVCVRVYIYTHTYVCLYKPNGIQTHVHHNMCQRMPTAALTA